MSQNDPDQHVTEPQREVSRRRLLGYGAGALGSFALSSTFLGACGGSDSKTTTSPDPSHHSSSKADPLAKLKTAATKEGAVTTCAVGVPHSYYAPIIEGFKKFAAIKVDAKNPTYIPSLEVKELADALRAHKPPPYDVVEIGVDTAADAVNQQLFEPYFSTNWADIPSAYKNDDALWAASYLGALSFLSNVTETKGFAPKSWDELASSPRTPKASFAMLGDPRSSQPLAGGLSMLTVMSAAIANGGSIDNVEPGIDLLSTLVDKGIFAPLTGTGLLGLPETAGNGESPIRTLFSFDEPLAQYNASLNKTKIQGNPPSDGLLVSSYPQGLAKGAVHPSAAKLWIEFLQSDIGAELFLRNGAIPVRTLAIRAKGTDELRALLPPEAVSSAPTPTVEQMRAAQKVIDAKWASKIPTKDS